MVFLVVHLRTAIILSHMKGQPQGLPSDIYRDFSDLFIFCIFIRCILRFCMCSPHTLGLLLCKSGYDVVGGAFDPAGTVGGGPDAVGGDRLCVAALEVGGDAGGTDDA